MTTTSVRTQNFQHMLHAFNSTLFGRPSQLQITVHKFTAKNSINFSCAWCVCVPLFFSSSSSVCVCMLQSHGSFFIFFFCWLLFNFSFFSSFSTSILHDSVERLQPLWSYLCRILLAHYTHIRKYSHCCHLKRVFPRKVSSRSHCRQTSMRVHSVD